MSQANLSTWRERGETVVAAINARDFDAIAEMPFVDPSFEFFSALSAVEGRSHVGASGLRDWAAEMDEVWDSFRIELTDLREAQDGRLVALYHVYGDARGSGVPLDTMTAQVWTLRNDKLWRNQSYTEPQAALEAVGLRE